MLSWAGYLAEGVLAGERAWISQGPLTVEPEQEDVWVEADIPARP